jgi:probable HAF family extracellular repeat protein
LRKLAALGEAGGLAYAINKQGMAAGLSYGDGGRAVMWGAGGLTNLGTQLGGNASIAYDINDLGQAVGESNSIVSGNQATLWRDGLVIGLGTLGGTGSRANAINNAGWAVGYAYLDGDYDVHATLWRDGQTIDLGTLPAKYGNSSFANGINNRGQVVGFSYDGGSSAPRAVLWDQGTITDLNAFLDPAGVADGWILRKAADINDRGWIVGTAFNKSTSATRGFLLTPVVPEPEGWTLLLGGGGVLAMVRRLQSARAATAARVVRRAPRA